jgi:hypothetical protein
MALTNNTTRKGNLIKCIMGTILLMLIMVTVSKAQTGSVNFSGTWAFNEAKSTPSEGGFRMGAGSFVIKQEGNNLSVERSSTGPDGTEMKTTSKFTLDGKESTNVAFGNSNRKSVVKWSADGKSLSFSHVMKFDMNGETTEIKSSETWKLNEADKTLIMDSVFNSPNGEMKSTNVYDKK